MNKQLARNRVYHFEDPGFTVTSNICTEDGTEDLVAVSFGELDGTQYTFYLPLRRAAALVAHLTAAVNGTVIANEARREF